MGHYLFILLIAIAAGGPEAPKAGYFGDLRPILQRNCQACHQPAIKQGNLDLTTYEGFKAGGAKGAAFVAGQPAKSLVLVYLTGAQQPQMPLGATPLSAEQIDLFRRWIAAGATDDTPAEARDTASVDKPRVYRQPPMINALAWSPDGALLAVSGYREVLLHKSDGTAIDARLPGLSDRIQTILFSADGKMLIAAGGTPARFGEVQLWDVPARKMLRSVTVTADTVFGASLAPDGKRLAVGGADNTVRLVDIASGEELAKLGHHENWVLGTAFGMDGKRLVTVGRDRAVKLSESASGAFLENLNLLRDQLYAVARHPRRDWVLVGGEDRVPYLYMMDRPRAMKIADDTTLVRKFEQQSGAVFAVAFTPDGGRAAIGGAGAEVNIYNVATGERAAACKGHQGGIYAVAFRPDGQQLATGGFDGRVRIYETNTCTLVREFIPVPLQ